MRYLVGKSQTNDEICMNNRKFIQRSVYSFFKKTKTYLTGETYIQLVIILDILFKVCCMNTSKYAFALIKTYFHDL